MNFPPYDDLAKIWEPTDAELSEFSKNKYVAKLNQGLSLNQSSCNHTQRNQSVEEISIHTFLYTMIKKTSHLENSSMLEEEAVLLCSMLKKGGFFDSTGESDCTICATEKLEKDIIETMQRQIEFTKLARNFYSQPENAQNYNLCDKHRPFNPSDYAVKTDQRHSVPRPILPAKSLNARNSKVETPEFVSTQINFNTYLEQFRNQTVANNYNHAVNLINQTAATNAYLTGQNADFHCQNSTNVSNQPFVYYHLLYPQCIANNFLNYTQNNCQIQNNSLSQCNVDLLSSVFPNYFTSLNDEQIRENQDSETFNSAIQNIIEEIQNRSLNENNGRFRKIRKILGKKYE